MLRQRCQILRGASGACHSPPAVAHVNLVRFPLEFSGDTDLWLELGTADVINFSARGVRVEALGDGRYVEICLQSSGRMLADALTICPRQI